MRPNRMSRTFGRPTQGRLRAPTIAQQLLLARRGVRRRSEKTVRMLRGRRPLRAGRHHLSGGGTVPQVSVRRRLDERNATGRECELSHRRLWH